jgi:hypothetical protein
MIKLKDVQRDKRKNQNIPHLSFARIASYSFKLTDRQTQSPSLCESNGSISSSHLTHIEERVQFSSHERLLNVSGL